MSKWGNFEISRMSDKVHFNKIHSVDYKAHIRLLMYFGLFLQGFFL